MIKLKTCYGDIVVIRVESIIHLITYGKKCKIYLKHPPFTLIIDETLENIHTKVLSAITNY